MAFNADQLKILEMAMREAGDKKDLPENPSELSLDQKIKILGYAVDLAKERNERGAVSATYLGMIGLILDGEGVQ